MSKLCKSLTAITAATFLLTLIPSEKAEAQTRQQKEAQAASKPQPAEDEAYTQGLTEDKDKAEAAKKAAEDAKTVAEDKAKIDKDKAVKDKIAGG